MRSVSCWIPASCLLLALTGCIAPSGSGSGDAAYVSRVDDPQAKALYHYGRFRLLFDEGKNEEAEAALREAIGFDPENEELRFELAEFYIEIDQIKQAVRVVVAG